MICHSPAVHSFLRHLQSTSLSDGRVPQCVDPEVIGAQATFYIWCQKNSGPPNPAKNYPFRKKRCQWMDYITFHRIVNNDWLSLQVPQQPNTGFIRLTIDQMARPPFASDTFLNTVCQATSSASDTLCQRHPLPASPSQTPFAGVTFLNTQTPFASDTFSGGGLILWDLEAVVALKPRDLFFFVDHLINHSNKTAHGLWNSIVAFMENQTWMWTRGCRKLTDSLIGE